MFSFLRRQNERWEIPILDQVEYGPSDYICLKGREVNEAVPDFNKYC